MGGSPYPGIKMEDIFSYLQSDKRMEQPASCPDELYQVMELCWQDEPVKRPHFHEIVSYLQRILQEKYTVSYQTFLLGVGVEKIRPCICCWCRILENWSFSEF